MSLFKTFWPTIVGTDYKPGVEVSAIAATLSSVSANVVDSTIIEVLKNTSTWTNMSM